MTAEAAVPISACMQLVHRLFYCLDESKYADLVALFTDDGSWHRQGELLSGHEQILQALAKRSATQRIRHLITNSFIESRTHDRVRLVAYLLAYRFDDGTRHTGPVEISRPLRLSVLRAALRPGDSGWQVAEMTLTPEFEFVDAASSGESAK